MRQIILLLSLLFSIYANAKPVVYIVKHQNLPAYNTAIETIKKDLSMDYELKTATVDRQTLDAVSKKIKKARPKLTITVGTKATKLIQSKLKRQPILFTMVFRPDRTDLVKNLKFPGKNATGVALDIPLEIQFKTLRTIFPYLRRIGTLYTPYLDQELIDEAKIIAEKYNFTLTANEVYSKDQIQTQLEKLFRQQIQLLWSTADQKVYSKKSLQYILLSLNRFKVPYMGLSKSYLKLGAYISLDPDPVHIGEKTAAMARKIIEKRKNPMLTPVEFPDDVRYSVNEKVMKQFRFNIAKDILDNAEVIYK
ncbi:MAG: ABC transporter substrate-binding protein [Candidatus Marinamargulisbacteria bacterium]